MTCVQPHSQHTKEWEKSPRLTSPLLHSRLGSWEATCTASRSRYAATRQPVFNYWLFLLLEGSDHNYKMEEHVTSLHSTCHSQKYSLSSSASFPSTYFPSAMNALFFFWLPLGLNLSSTGRKPSLTAHLCHVHLTLGPKAPLHTDLYFSKFVFSCFGSPTEDGGHAGLVHHCTTRTPYRCSEGSK